MMLINTLLLAIASVASATMLSEREYQELADLESRAVPNCFTIYSLIQCQGTCDFTGAGDECGASYCYQECFEMSCYYTGTTVGLPSATSSTTSPSPTST